MKEGRTEGNQGKNPRRKEQKKEGRISRKAGRDSRKEQEKEARILRKGMISRNQARAEGQKNPKEE